MGFYYPDTHFIQASRNPYKPPTVSVIQHFIYLFIVTILNDSLLRNSNHVLILLKTNVQTKVTIRQFTEQGIQLWRWTKAIKKIIFPRERFMLISLNVNFVVQVYNQFFRTFLLQDILNVSLEIPKTGKYRVLVKYTNEGVKAQLNVALQFQNTSGANDPMIFSASLAEGCDNCLETINPDLDYLSLTNGTWMISITTMQRYDQLKLVKSQFAFTPLLFYLNYIAISWYSTILLHRNVKCETDTKVVTKS